MMNRSVLLVWEPGSVPVVDADLTWCDGPWSRYIKRSTLVAGGYPSEVRVYLLDIDCPGALVRMSILERE